MDAKRFDAVTKAVATRSSRRTVLAGIGAITGGSIGRALGIDDARAARRGFIKPVLTGSAACAPVGDPCASAVNCCSLCCISGGEGPGQCVERGSCL